MSAVRRLVHARSAQSGVALLGLTLVLTSTLPAAPAAAATGAVQVVSSSSFIEERYVHVAGQVVNHTGHTVSSVSVVVDQFDSRGTLLGTDKAYAETSVLDDGEFSGFETMFEAPGGYDHFSIRSAGGDQSYRPANRTFAVTVTNRYAGQYGDDHVVGTIENLNTGKASFVSVEATYFDEAGTAVGSASAYTTPADGSRAMAPGETDSFDVTYDGPATPASYVLIASSLDDPSPLPTSWVSSGGGTRSYGQGAAITGRITKRGTDSGLDATVVQLLAQPAGSSSWSVVLTGKTNYDGQVSFSPRPERNTSYALRIPASTSQQGSQSPSQAVLVNALNTAKLSTANIKLGRTASLTATVSPGQAGRLVTLQRLVSGRWTNVSSHALDGRSTWVFAVKPAARGTYTYRTSSAAYAANGAGTSAPVSLKVS